MEKTSLSKEKNFISIVVYVRNSEKNIKKFITKLDKIFYDKFEDYEFILVNDCSNDRSLQEITSVAKEISGNLSVVNMAWKHNMELAMLAGVNIAIGDFIFEFDCPLINYDIDTLWKVYKTCIKGYDVVSAASNKPLKLSSKLFYTYLNIVSFRKMELTTETFRIVSRRALNRVLKAKSRIRYRKALYHYSGFETKIIHYKSINNLKVQQDVSISEKIDLAMNVLISYSNIGTRLSGSISLIFFLLSVLAGIYTIRVYLTVKNIQPGWTTTMLFLSLSFTGIFLILALISKYLTAILFEVQEKPQYTYKSVEKLSNK